MTRWRSAWARWARPNRTPTKRAVAYAVTIVPFVVAAVRALANGWFPIGDAAQLYIRATDVLTGNHPWIGSGSSASAALGFQVNNAGPLYYDLIAPFARTLPPGWGAVLGVTTVNVASIVLAGVAARRIGGSVFEAWVLAAAAVLAWTMGSELLFDMFQAHALLFPFLAACVLLTGAACGSRWVWPWLALVLSVIAQTHVSYAYILPLLVVAAAALGFAGLPAPRRVAWRTAAPTAAVLAAAWIQPVYEQLFGPGEGNLSRLARAAGGTEITLGGANAARLTAAFVALPPWAGRQGFADTIAPSGITTGPDGQEVVTLAGMPSLGTAVAALALTIALLGIAVWWAHRRTLPPLRALAALALVGVVGAVLAFSRLTVTVLGFAPHHTRWVIVVALLTYVALGWALVDAATVWWARRQARERCTVALLAVAGCALVVFTLLNLGQYAQPHGPTADAAAQPGLRSLFDQLDAHEFADPVFFDLTNERVYAPHTSAIQLHLRDRGIEFRVDSEFLVRHLGEGRRGDGSEPTTLRQYHDAAAQAPADAGCVVLRVPPTGSAPGWPSMWLAATLSGPGACR